MPVLLTVVADDLKAGGKQNVFYFVLAAFDYAGADIYAAGGHELRHMGGQRKDDVRHDVGQHQIVAAAQLPA